MPNIPNPYSELLREPNLLIPGKKPVGPVKIDWSHDLSKGILLATLFYDQREKVSSDALAFSSSPTIRQGDYENAVSGTEYITAPLINTSADKLTIIARVIPYFPTTTTPYKYLITNDSSSGTPSVGFRFLYSRDGDDYRLVVRISSTSYNVEMTENDAFQNQDFVLAARYDGSELTLWKDGEKKATTASVTGNIDQSSASDTYIGSRSSGDNYYWEGVFKYMYVWDRALSDIEIREIALDPYQFLIPA